MTTNIDKREAAMRQEIEELTAQRDQLADILTRTANALKGEPAELMQHSWHDLPEVAQQLKAAQQEPWGACVSGRVFVGGLPEHARKLAEDEGLPIQWLYTRPQAREPLTDEQIRELTGNAGTLMQEYAIKVARAIEAAHGIKGDA